MNLRRLAADVLHTVIPLALGICMIRMGEWMALALGMPALAMAGTLGGITLASLGPARLVRRLVFPHLDLMALMRTAIAKDPGRVWQGVCMVIAALIFSLSGGTARGQDIPANARLYLPVLVAEQQAHWSDLTAPSVLAAQVEQETCISLKHPRCWSPRAELRTSREQGVGLSQITRTWRPDGSLRFDSLAELRAQFPRQLAGWGWDLPTLHDPAYQIRALILMDRRNWLTIQGAASDTDRMAMTLASYNGGLRGLAADRAMCAGTAGCDPGVWAGHVERTCTKATVAATGYGRSFCDINREYPRNILGPRRAKYLAVLGA